MLPILFIDQILNYLISENQIKEIKKERYYSFEVNGHFQKRNGPWSALKANYFFNNFGTYRDIA